jgi:hypothetical protein
MFNAKFFRTDLENLCLARLQNEIDRASSGSYCTVDQLFTTSLGRKHKEMGLHPKGKKIG